MDIREIVEWDELHAVETLQREVWGCDDLEILPAIHMVAARHVGAILLGAFEGGALIGFVYGFPGFEGDVRVIHSDMLAVRSEYRDRGLGRALKLAQRSHALARGVARITWTFDPQQTRNANLNLNGLGVIAGRYYRDFYGRTTSPLHAGGTDRLWVTWYLDRRPDTDEVGQRIAVRSREQMRLDFESAFASGLAAVGFDREKSEYLLGRLRTT